MSIAAITSLIAVLKDPISDVMNRFFPDKAKAKEAADALLATIKDHSHEIDLAQIEVNKEQVKHPSIFVAGARPFTMWVGGLGFAYNVLAYPILDIWFEMPPVETELLYPLLFGLLGLGGIRSVEKVKGVARENMRTSP